MQAGHTYLLTDTCTSILGEVHLQGHTRIFFALFQRKGLEFKIGSSDVPISIRLKVASERVQTKPEEHGFGSQNDALGQNCTRKETQIGSAVLLCNASQPKIG